MTMEARNAPELKWNDIGGNAVYVADTTGVVTLLNGMVRGLDAVGNRIGRKIYNKQVLIRGAVAMNAANGVGAGANQSARIIVFEDRDGNGAAPAVVDVLVAANAFAMYNLNNRDRFKILYDKQTTFTGAGNNGAAYVGAGSIAAKVDIDLPVNVCTIFNAGNAGTAADINSGAIYMLTVGTIAAGANASGYDLNTRVRYADA